MERTHVSVGALVDRIDRGEIKLPEIQRAYVWKPAQVARFFDSLYRRYPSGAMLLWRPDEEVLTRAAAITESSLGPVGSPQYLLDGQQRLTSLHRVYKRHADAAVVFNIEDERFQIQSAATAKDDRWVLVAEVLTDEKLGPIRKRIVEAHPDLDEYDVEDRLQRLRRIDSYEYYLEILTNMKYDEVAQIFVRVNSGGRALRTVDLTLALLSVQWPGVVAKVDDAAAKWEGKGWNKLDATFLVRALAATATDAAVLPQLRNLSPEELEAGWDKVLGGLDLLIPILEDANITSGLVPSVNALVPLVVLLSRYGTQDAFTESRALIYWLLGVSITARYSAAADTKIAQDALAARSDDPLAAMYRSAGLADVRLAVTSQQLVAKGAGSAYFLMSYLVAKERNARAWWHDVEIAEGWDGALAIEYHHIHPQKTLRDRFSKSEINDLSNLAFISATANKKISDRSPADYFPELLPPVRDDELSPHLVPLDETLRTADAYPQFLAARRELLANAMSSLLDKYRPDTVGTLSDSSTKPTESVSLVLYAGPSGRVVFQARRGDENWEASCLHAELLRYLRDATDGVASNLKIGGVEAVFEPDEGDVVVPVGPFDITGSLAEWDAALLRELEEARSITELDGVAETQPEPAESRTPFPVQDTD